MNVAVPDDLYERYQTIKDDVGNVSAMFQQALEQKVELIESQINATSNKEKIVNKLKYQKKNFDNQVFNSGKTKGLNFVEKLTYKDFLELEKLADAHYELGNKGLTLELDDFPYDIQDEILPEDFTGEQEIFLKGWLEGVMEFWDKTKEAI